MVSFWVALSRLVVNSRYVCLFFSDFNSNVCGVCVEVRMYVGLMRLVCIFYPLSRPSHLVLGRMGKGGKRAVEEFLPPPPAVLERDSIYQYNDRGM